MYKWELEPFGNVPTTGKAIASFPRLLGNAVPQITLEMGGGALTKAMLTLIRVKANQKTLWEVTGNQLNSINLYDGYPTVATELSLPFQSLRARDVIAQHAGSIDLSRGYSNFGVEVDITGATTPTLKGYGHVMPALAKQGPGLADLSPVARVLLPTTISVAAAVTDLPVRIAQLELGGYLVRRIFLFHTNLTGFKFFRDGVDQYERFSNTLVDFWADESGHDPQAGLKVLDFCEDDNLSEALRTNRSDGTVANNVLKITTSGADTVTAIIDALAVPGLI